MTRISIIKCDGPGCKKQIDNNEPLADTQPTYHYLCIGGSDFEMSFSVNREYHFCSIECISKFLDTYYPKHGSKVVTIDNWKIEKNNIMCDYRTHSGKYPYCYHQVNESEYCKWENCPLK